MYILSLWLTSIHRDLHDGWTKFLVIVEGMQRYFCYEILKSEYQLISRGCKVCFISQYRHVPSESMLACSLDNRMHESKEDL